jgi:hypothetical protein
LFVALLVAHQALGARRPARETVDA